MDGEKAIRKLIDTWMAVNKAGEPEKVLDLMTDDMVFLVPGKKPFGKEAFQGNPMKIGKPGGMAFDGEAKIEEIKVFDNWAYARVYLKITMIPHGKEPIHRSGYTLSIYRKESDGKWRLCRDANMVG